VDADRSITAKVPEVSAIAELGVDCVLDGDSLSLGLRVMQRGRPFGAVLLSRPPAVRSRFYDDVRSSCRHHTTPLVSAESSGCCSEVASRTLLARSASASASSMIRCAA